MKHLANLINRNRHYPPSYFLQGMSEKTQEVFSLNEKEINVEKSSARFWMRKKFWSWMRMMATQQWEALNATTPCT